MRRGSPPAEVQLETPTIAREAEFLAAVHRSRRLHGQFAAPPNTPASYRAFLERAADPRHLCHLVCTAEGDLAGVVNINEILRGVAQYGYLGYYALVPNAGRGHMRAGIARVVQSAFAVHGLHRLEANIQPNNPRSLALVRGLGFRHEGFSPRYLKLAGRWRDHERWAITREDWKTVRRSI